jgi:hypothetical protein
MDGNNLNDSYSSFENILKLENTDSLLLSRTHLTQNSGVERRSKKKSTNEKILEEQIIKQKKEKPIWLKKSLIAKLKSEGYNVESTYILKVKKIIQDAVHKTFL